MDNFPHNTTKRVRSTLRKKYGIYEVIEELGKGGMGVVYKVYDPTLNRQLALKILLHNRVYLRKRFAREAQAIAKLDHPCIVKCYNFFSHENTLCIAMEYVDGMTLRDWLQHGQLSLVDQLQMFVKIIDAVDYAHSRNVLHRDLKPENIIISRQQQPYLTDFGLAKITHTKDKSLTKTGTFMGTPSYMPPEQVRGRLREIDCRSDVFSLGVILYEIITQQMLFPMTNVNEVFYKIVHEKISPPSSVDQNVAKALDQICLKALQKDKKRRYRTAAHMAQDLRAFLDGESLIFAKRPMGKWIMALCLCAFFATGIYLYITTHNKKKPKSILPVAQSTQKIEQLYFQPLTKLMAEKDYSGAQRCLQKIFAYLQEHPGEQGSYCMSMFHLYMGMCLLEQPPNSAQLNPQIVDFLQKAQRELPNEPKVYEYLGRYYMQNNQLTLAIENLRKSSILQPYNSDIHNYIGEVLQRQKKHREAQQKFIKAIEVNHLNFRALINLYRASLDYPDLHHFLHYQAIAINYAFVSLSPPDIFDDELKSMQRKHYISYFYWRNNLLDQFAVDIPNIHYYRFANLHSLQIQKELHNAQYKSTQKNMVSIEQIQDILYNNNERTLNRYLAAQSLLYTPEFDNIMRSVNDDDYILASICLCALHAKGFVVKIPPKLTRFFYKIADNTLQTLLAQNMEDFDLQLLKKWMKSTDAKLAVCAAGNAFNQRSISAQLMSDAENILIASMKKSRVVRHYAHYYFWNSLYSQKPTNENLYRMGLEDADDDINTTVLRCCRIFDEKVLRKYAQTYLKDKSVGKRELALVYALTCLNSKLPEQIIQDPQAHFALRVLTRHITVYSLVYLQNKVTTIPIYLMKMAESIKNYSSEDIRAANYAYIAITLGYNLSYDAIKFFAEETSRVQLLIMHNLQCASKSRHPFLQRSHEEKVAWVKQHLDHSDEKMRKAAWAAWTAMSIEKHEQIYNLASSSKNVAIRQGAARGFYSTFYFTIRRAMPSYNDRMSSAQNFNELYYNGIARLLRGVRPEKAQQLVQMLSRAIVLDREKPEYYFHRGLCFKATQNYRLAKKDLQKALQLQKDNLRYQLALAEVTFLEDVSKRAYVAEQLKFIVDKTRSSAIEFCAGKLYLQMKMFREAKKILRKVYLQNPHDFTRGIWLVKAYWDNDEQQPASKLLHAMIKSEALYLNYANKYRRAKLSRQISPKVLPTIIPQINLSLFFPR